MTLLFHWSKLSFTFLKRCFSFIVNIWKSKFENIFFLVWFEKVEGSRNLISEGGIGLKSTENIVRKAAKSVVLPFAHTCRKDQFSPPPHLYLRACLIAGSVMKHMGLSKYWAFIFYSSISILYRFF